MKELLNELGKYVDSCKKCGFCKAVCPIFKSSIYIETAGPRGRMLMLQGLLEGALKPSTYMSRRLFCTLCGYCSVKCVSGLKLTEAYILGRQYLLANNVVLEGIKRIIDNVVEYSNPYGVDQSVKSMWLDFLDERPPDRAEVAYFVGCTTSIKRWETAAAAYTLLKNIEGSVAVLSDEPCCNVPLYLAGDVRGFREGIIKLLRRFRDAGVHTVVTTCPACTRSLREYAAEVGVVHDVKVYHVVEYLYDLLKSGRLPKLSLEAVVTYHDPCELSRHLGRVKEPREILRSIEGLKLVEMRGSGLESNCCGGGGLYQVLNPDEATSITVSRLEDLPKGVNIIVTACPSCVVQLSNTIQGLGAEVEVIDFSEVVLRSLGK